MICTYYNTHVACFLSVRLFWLVTFFCFSFPIGEADKIINKKKREKERVYPPSLTLSILCFPSRSFLPAPLFISYLFLALSPSLLNPSLTSLSFPLPSLSPFLSHSFLVLSCLWAREADICKYVNWTSIYVS